MRIAAFTSLTWGYLSRGAVLARTLKRVHPDWVLHLLLVDEPDGSADFSGLLSAFDEIVLARDLPIDGFRGWMFKHDVVEACTAVKGAMLCRLLEGGADAVVYLDPDIAVFHPLDTTVRALGHASVVLTPHQVEPSDAASSRDNEMASLKYGIYNLGFLAVRNDPAGHDFARWWDAQLRRECYDEPERGVFTDQKFCDLVPGLFRNVHVDRDPGCNVASWNLARRRLAFTADGDIQSNGYPLKFYHFTKILGAGETMTDRASVNNPAAFELVTWYRREIRSEAAKAGPIPDWGYGRFTNGLDIPKAIRVLYRERPDLMSYFADPFQAGPGSFLEWLGREMPQHLPAAIDR